MRVRVRGSSVFCLLVARGWSCSLRVAHLLVSDDRLHAKGGAADVAHTAL
jgi:hypothetical protein